ncbi:sugar phosphate nucleotidyltransferase [Halobellus sp. EA9]|uniref:sugar phosphate nucleotidyltransferase n=1 Tax=Halobellus sp. EA9 TaxID=3421647 RepID=UPI003EC07500
MKAVILAAGEGTRLRPRTAEIPKPLVEVAGAPILTRCFETVRDLGVDEAVVVVGYEKEAIVDRYGDAYRDLDLRYAHQEERTGLAHAVLAAADQVDADFAVLNGDNVYAGNLDTVLRRHRETDADLTVPVHEVSRETARAGAVCELDEDGTVTGFVEKPDDPPSRYAPAAFYVLPPAVFHACRLVRPSSRGEYELADAIDLLVRAGYRVETVPFEGRKVNVNTEADVERAERLLDRID